MTKILVNSSGKAYTSGGNALALPTGVVEWGDIGGTLSNQTDLQTALNGKLTGNTSITGASKCKITYDSKGLVTAGADLQASDIPDISATYQTKITSSAKLSADLISDGTTNKTVTATEKSTWSGKQDALVSGTNIKTINNTSILGSGNISVDSLPSQTSQSGKYLTTNGTTASWAEVPTEIPSQSGNSGKFLTTNGSAVSWANAPTELPTQTGNSGKFLTTNGSAVSWAIVDALPSQTSQSGKYLTTNGTTASWADIPTEIPSQSGQSGKFLTTNGSAVSWANTPSPSIDSKSITTNGSSQLQTSGVIDQNNTSNAIKMWSGTKSQYDALVSGGTIDSNTLYNITDDGNPYTTLLSTIYPVGCLYFGTGSTCPMASILGTWTLVGTKILTEVTGSSSVPVRGNSMTLGLTNGSTNSGLVSTTVAANYNLGSNDASYGVAVGTTKTNTYDNDGKSWGITTDASKSGIIADISNSLTKTSITVNIWQRTA